jgi:hypothetical protein
MSPQEFDGANPASRSGNRRSHMGLIGGDTAAEPNGPSGIPRVPPLLLSQ